MFYSLRNSNLVSSIFIWILYTSLLPYLIIHIFFAIQSTSINESFHVFYKLNTVFRFIHPLFLFSVIWGLYISEYPNLRIWCARPNIAITLFTRSVSLWRSDTTIVTINTHSSCILIWYSVALRIFWYITHDHFNSANRL